MYMLACQDAACTLRMYASRCSWPAGAFQGGASSVSRARPACMFRGCVAAPSPFSDFPPHRLFRWGHLTRAQVLSNN